MIKLAALCLASCLCICAQQASLEGQTVDAVTQAPLAGVHVSLVSLGVGTNLPEPDDAYGAISNASGHYSIGNIRPGTYIISSKRAGFVYVRATASNATPTISLKAGQLATVYTIVMTPEATITGRVIDESGDPVQGAEVRVVSMADVPPYGSWAMRDETNDRGEYRISGIPGKYYVEAAVRPPESSGSPEIRSDGSSTEPYAATWYPGSLARERAKLVEMTAGSTVNGIDVHVARRKNLKISGVVTGLPAGAANGSHARVAIGVSFGGRIASDTIDAGSDGSFSFTGLEPGEYHLGATYGPGATANLLQSPFLNLTIENEDATVTLPLSEGEDLRGTLQIEGDPPDQMPALHLRPVGGEGSPAFTKEGRVAPDGSFVFGGIVSGAFRLTVDPLPENAYVKSVLLGGIETLDRDLDLSKGVQGITLKVTVSRHGGQVSGGITGPDGRRIMSRRLLVILAEDANIFATWRSVLSSDLTFAISGVRPGKYRLFAIDPSQFGDLSSYEPMKEIAARAEVLEVKEGDRVSKDLRLSGRDAALAK